MDFGEMQDLVIRRTKRPDKADTVRDGINAAIAFFASGNFEADRVELDAFSIDSSLFAQSFDISASPFVRFKVIDYIRPAGYNRKLDYRDPKHVFNNGKEMLDVYYRSGVNIIFKLCRLQSTLKLGYFQYHLRLDDDDADSTDWIMTEMTEAVALYARSRVMRDVGEDTEANNNYKEALILWEVYKQSINAMQA